MQSKRKCQAINSRELTVCYFEDSSLFRFVNWRRACCSTSNLRFRCSGEVIPLRNACRFWLIRSLSTPIAMFADCRSVKSPPLPLRQRVEIEFCEVALIQQVAQSEGQRFQSRRQEWTRIHEFRFDLVQCPVVSNDSRLELSVAGNRR